MIRNMSPEEQEAARYSLADFLMSFTDDPLQADPDFVQWRKATAWAGSQYHQRLEGPAIPRTVVDAGGGGRPMLNLSSYNYLGMVDHPEVIAAAQAALARYGLGSCGSPMISGLSDLHRQLEEELSGFLGREDTLLFNSGFAGVLGITAGLLRKGDVAIVDERIHISALEGVRLSGARLKLFAHNDPASLGEVLESTRGARRVVMVEGIYSLDGDMADLPRIAPICQAHGVGLIIDEAHSVLTCGARGRGVAERFGLSDAVGLYYGTFSKAFAGIGGFASGPAETIDYLRHYAASYGFSCALPPAIVAALLKVLELVATDPTPMTRLQENAAYFRERLQALGADIGPSTSHVVPIIVGSDRTRLYRAANRLRDRGLFLVPFDYPSVPEDGLRFRACVTAAHTRADLDEALEIIGEALNLSERPGR